MFPSCAPGFLIFGSFSLLCCLWRASTMPLVKAHTVDWLVFWKSRPLKPMPPACQPLCHRGGISSPLEGSSPSGVGPCGSLCTHSSNGEHVKHHHKPSSGVSVYPAPWPSGYDGLRRLYVLPGSSLSDSSAYSHLFSGCHCFL